MITHSQLRNEAQKLLSGSALDECRRRSAISRAYLVAFHKIMVSVKECGHSYDKGNGSLPERQIVDFIRKSGDKNLQNCYSIYISLWKFYRDADFYLNSSVSMRDALEAHELMEQIIGNL